MLLTALTGLIGLVLGPLVIAMIGPVTSSMARIVASRGGSPSSM